MLDDAAVLRAKSDEVAAKIVDGEAILINLMSGVYYTVEGAGAEIWSRLENGSSIAQLSVSIAESYDVGPEQAHKDVERLVKELLEEGLIVPDGGPADPAEVATGAGPGSATYETPRLVKYDDMADMFALDPPLPELPPVNRLGRT